MNTQKVKDYVCLEKRKRDLDAELKQVKQQLGDLEGVVINEMVNAGFDEVTAEGRTLKVVPKVFASPAEGRFEVVQAFREAGLTQYLPENYNDAALRGFVNEMAAEVMAQAQQEDRLITAEDIRAALPEPLGRALKIYLGHALSSRKA